MKKSITKNKHSLLHARPCHALDPPCADGERPRTPARAGPPRRSTQDTRDWH